MSSLSVKHLLFKVSPKKILLLTETYFKDLQLFLMINCKVLGDPRAGSQDILSGLDAGLPLSTSGTYNKQQQQ